MSESMHAPGPCPHCAVAMREVAARARTGYLIALDQCPQCGGVWCDRWELFPLAPEEAQRIDAVDEAHLQATMAPATAPGHCPRCTAPLHPLRDPLLPPDARIERCRVCDGMWMNRGELARAKQRSPPTHAPPSRAALEQLAATVGTTSNWSKVANLDAATYAADDDGAEDTPSAGAILWSSGPWIVARTLLGLLLRV